MFIPYQITKGSSSGATLSFASRSIGEKWPAPLPDPLPPPPRQKTLKANPKHCNLHGFVTFAWKNHLLQHAENYVNTRVFARCCPKNAVNTMVVFARAKKHRYLRCCLLRESQKTRKHQLFDDFRPLRATTTTTPAAAATTTTTPTATIPWFWVCAAPKTLKYAVFFVPEAFKNLFNTAKMTPWGALRASPPSTT